MNEEFGFLAWLARLLSNDKFLVSFYATVGAAITILLLQFVTMGVMDKRKKLYAVAAILDVCYRI